MTIPGGGSGSSGCVSPVWNNIPLFDLNGNPLSNGVIYVYNGGSWTVLAQEPTTLNANGSTGSSLGLPCQVYVNMKLTDQYGNIIDIQEQVLGIAGPGAPSVDNSCGSDPANPTITWTASTPGTNPIGGYTIYRSTSYSGTYSQIGSVGASTLSFTDTNAASGMTYYYYVVAFDTSYIPSSNSNIQSCTPASGPWVLEYTASGTGNSNGGGFQAIVSDDVGTNAMVIGSPAASSSDGGNTWALNTTFPSYYQSPEGLFFNGTYFVGLDDGSQQAYFSTDLNTWTTDGNNLGVYQLHQDTGTGAIYASPYPSSTNTTLWRNPPNANYFVKVIDNQPGPSLATYGNAILTANGVTVSTFGAYPTYNAWYSLNNGVTWTASPTSIDGDDVFGLTFNGTLWLLVTEQFNSPYDTVCWTSPDGMNWTNALMTNYSNPPYDSEVTAFNGYFLSWTGATIARSTDAVTWTTTVVGTGYLAGITAGDDIAYAYSSNGIFESTDGVTWTLSNMTSNALDVSVAGLTLAAASTSSYPQEGQVWKRPPPTVANPWIQVLSANVSSGSNYPQVQVASAGNLVYATGKTDQISTNAGSSWSASTAFNTATGYQLYTLFSNSTYIFGTDGNGAVWSSADLSTWTQMSLTGYGGGALYIAIDQQTGDIYLCQDQGSGLVYIWHIANGTNTGTLVTTNAAGPNFLTQTPLFNKMASNGSRIVSGYFDSGSTICQMYYSDNNGSTWTAGTTLTTGHDILRLAWGNGTFLAVGSDGSNHIAWTSTDGATWTNVYNSSSGPPFANELMSFQGTFLNTSGGELVYSPDGVNWTATTTPISGILEFISFNNRGYVAGVGGIAETVNGSLFKLANTTTGVVESIWYDGTNTYAASSVNNYVTVFKRSPA